MIPWYGTIFLIVVFVVVVGLTWHEIKKERSGVRRR